MKVVSSMFKRQRLFQVLGLILCLLYISGTAFAQEDSSMIEIRTIGIPPYGIADSPTPSGIYYDIANQLVSEAGYTANNHIYPYARIINELKTGQTDLSIMFKYEELVGYVTYIEPLPTLRTVVIGGPGTSFDSIDSLKGKTLAYLRGATFSDEIDNDPTITKLITNDFSQSLRMLGLGRVDAIIGPLEPILAAAGARSNLGDPLVVDERTPWVQISNKSISRLSVERLRSIFLDIQNRGDLDLIRNKYSELGE